MSDKDKTSRNSPRQDHGPMITLGGDHSPERSPKTARTLTTIVTKVSKKSPRNYLNQPSVQLNFSQANYNKLDL
jgi:hypothetical protein